MRIVLCVFGPWACHDVNYTHALQMKAWAKVHGINSSKDRTLNSLSIISIVAFHLQVYKYLNSCSLVLHCRLVSYSGSRCYIVDFPLVWFHLFFEIDCWSNYSKKRKKRLIAEVELVQDSKNEKKKKNC